MERLSIEVKKLGSFDYPSRYSVGGQVATQWKAGEKRTAHSREHYLPSAAHEVSRLDQRGPSCGQLVAGNALQRLRLIENILVKGSHLVFRFSIVPAHKRSRRAYQTGVGAQGGEPQLCFFRWNLSTNPANDAAGAIQEQTRAFHHPSTQRDDAGSKERDEVGQSQPEIFPFAFDRAKRVGIPLPR